MLHRPSQSVTGIHSSDGAIVSAEDALDAGGQRKPGYAVSAVHLPLSAKDGQPVGGAAFLQDVLAMIPDGERDNFEATVRTWPLRTS